MPAVRLLLTAVLGLAAVDVTAAADALILRNGGRIRGHWLNRDQQPLVAYDFQTAAGVRLSIPRRSVERVARETEQQAAYRARFPVTPDTLDAQWALAQWCRSQGLKAESRRHMERVVQHDPNHDEARRLLGYRWWRGRWLTREQVHAENGYVLYQGRYRTQQEARLLEAESESGRQQIQWRQDLTRWCRQLESGDADRARRQIEQVRSPAAVVPLRELIDSERQPATRLLLLQQLLEIRNDQSSMTLAELILQTDGERLFDEALRELLNRNRPALVEFYVKVLESNHSGHLNRAATALGELGDVAAITPLIESLQTTHWQLRAGQPLPLPLSQVPRVAGQPQRCDAATQTSCPNFHQSVQLARRNNPEVLRALTKLSDGRSFGYHPSQWRIWNQARLSVLQRGELRRTQ